MVLKKSMLWIFLLLSVYVTADPEIHNGILKKDVNLTTFYEEVIEKGTSAQQRFLTIHEVASTDTFKTLIWPKELCQVVVFCNSDEAAVEQVDTTSNETETVSKSNKLYTEGLCQKDKLIYLAYESSIQKIDETGTAGAKFYLPSPSLVFEPSGSGKTKIMVATDYNNVGGTIEATESLEMELNGKMATLTSSPYCQIVFERNGMNVASFDTVTSEQLTELDLTELSYFQLTNNKKESVLLSEMSTLANPKPVNKTDRKKVALCDDYWSVPTYPRKKLGKSNDDSRLLVQEYSYKVNANKKRDYSAAREFTSFILETEGLVNGGDCPWVKICFGPPKECSTPNKVLELLFDYGMFVPTDSDSAHAFGAPRQHLRRIRFRIQTMADGAHVLGMSYGLSGLQEVSILSHWMKLADGSYNTFKLNGSQRDFGSFTLVSDRSCNARLLNDWTRLTRSRDTTLEKQILTIRKCTVME